MQYLVQSIAIFLWVSLFIKPCCSQTINITTADIESSIISGRDTGVVVKDSVRFTIIKTDGSTLPLNESYPTGAPLNILPKAKFSHVEGIHLGRTWGENGTGTIDAYGQLRTEQYTLTFSKNLSELSFILGGLNDCSHGVERFKIVDVRADHSSVLDNIKFSIRVDFDDDESDSYIFNPRTREIKGGDFPQQTGWEESAVFKIASSVPFNTILVERKDYENKRPDKNWNGQNYSNGVTLTNFNLILAEPKIIKTHEIKVVKETPTTISKKLKIGTDLTKKLKINPIYFDYDKSNINTAAATELDKIVKFMNENPKIEIELGSHTDCRGSKKYNLRLSDARAKSSIKYIQAHITKPKRIQGRGYGESKLINECDCENNEETSCTEEEHQENRRTEFILIKN